MSTAVRGPDDVEGLRARSTDRVRRARAGRRVGLIVMWAVVVAGAVGLLGVRTSTVTATGDGYTLRLEQASVARAGWDVPWRLEVTHPGGFDGGVTIAVSRSFFDVYEEQGLHPDADGQTSDGRWVYLEFAPPPGDVLSVDYDAYVQPSAQLGRSYDVRLLTDGEVRAQLHARTVLLP